MYGKRRRAVIDDDTFTAASSSSADTIKSPPRIIRVTAFDELTSRVKCIAPANKAQRIMAPRLRPNSSSSSSQLCLDFNQRSLAPSTCRECGMLYHRNDQYDEQVHRELHRRAVDGIIFRAANALSATAAATNSRLPFALPAGDAIFIVRGDDDGAMAKWSAAARTAMADAVSFMDEQLGAVAHESVRSGESLFLYATSAPHLRTHRGQRIVGVLRTKHITTACEVIPPEQTDEDDCAPTTTRLSDRTAAATLGVEHIYVWREHRRRGVSTRLIDAACALSDGRIDRANVAFAQPTREGALFAASYTGRKCFLSYL